LRKSFQSTPNSCDEGIIALGFQESNVRKSFIVASVCMAMLAISGAAEPATLVAQDAWVRLTPGSEVAAVYLSLHNTGPRPIIVIGVQSPIASESMMHETSLVNGQSQMRMRDRIVVAPGQTVRFAPGGLHIMLSGLKQLAPARQTVPLVLLLADGGRISLAAVVKPLAIP
jgi:periplasmic copper chaperone A